MSCQYLHVGEREGRGKGRGEREEGKKETEGKERGRKGRKRGRGTQEQNMKMNKVIHQQQYMTSLSDHVAMATTWRAIEETSFGRSDTDPLEEFRVHQRELNHLDVRV